MFDRKLLDNMNIDDLFYMLVSLYIELFDVSKDRAMGMASELLKKELISEIQWVDDILDK